MLLTALVDPTLKKNFEGALGAMAITSIWLTLITAVTPVVLTFVLPRLFQRELRRLQLESETRLKRLEALEKAMSVVGKAKELTMEITTDDLQNELGRILHEFAGPVVRSREALEDWANEAIAGRFLLTPCFSAPKKEARFVRGMRIQSFMAISMVLLYGTLTILMLYGVLNSYGWEQSSVYCAFWGFLYFLWRLYILRESKSALKVLRATPKNTTEVKTPVLVSAGLPA